MKRKYTKEQFELAVSTSINIMEVLVKLGLSPTGGNYKCIYNTAKRFGVDISHLTRKSTYGVEKAKREDITDEQLLIAIQSSISIHSTLNKLRLSKGNSNQIWIREKIGELDIDVSHFLGQAHLRGKTHNWGKKTPLDEFLVENGEYRVSSHSLKKRLIREGILEDKCAICGITMWHEQKLSLHLDHINGKHNDNRLENLRLLCPNCHSLTDTYAGKNKRRKDKPVKVVRPPKIKVPQYCLDCGSIVKDGKTGYCLKCKNKHQNYPRKTKIEWPSIDILAVMVWEKSVLVLAKELGVSDNAIRKRCRRAGIKLPGVGYWAKKKAGKL